MTDVTCINCGRDEDRETGVVTHYYPDTGVICNICRTSSYYSLTVLSEAEARVATLKEWGYTHPEIAEILQNLNGDDTPKKSTVDEYSRRIADKRDKAKRTLEFLPAE